jgi:hypothetical protein
MEETPWLLMKRGLYYRPNDCGYTGIRDHAGRYSAEDAKARLHDGVTMVREDVAAEFSPACFADLALAHVLKQRDEATAEIVRLRSGMSRR